MGKGEKCYLIRQISDIKFSLLTLMVDNRKLTGEDKTL